MNSGAVLCCSAVPVAMLMVIAASLYGPGRRFQAKLLRRDRLRRGLCVNCGYDLTGNASGVCPECGTGKEAEENGDDGGKRGRI